MSSQFNWYFEIVLEILDCFRSLGWALLMAYQGLNNANLLIVDCSHEVLLRRLDRTEKGKGQRHYVIFWEENHFHYLIIMFHITNWLSLLIAILLGDEMRHVGLVDHEEGDGDCLLPAEVGVDVPGGQHGDYWGEVAIMRLMKVKIAISVKGDWDCCKFERWCA